MTEYADAFRAMDTDVDVIIQASRPPTDAFLNARLLFERQESRFSRFRPGSLLSRLNAGETVTDDLMARACRYALGAFEETGGLFNPMILPALAAAGYDRTFASVSGGEPRPLILPDPRDALSLAGDSVRLKAGQLDLGGIAKGWTVDLAVEAVAASYPDVFINAGGDLRCAGREPGIDGWHAEISAPGGGSVCWEGAVTGALATSNTLGRRWITSAGTHAHHLIDPRTGLPSESEFIQVSAWAETARPAEVWAKAVVIGGEEAAHRATVAGLRLVAIGRNGEVRSY